MIELVIFAAQAVVCGTATLIERALVDRPLSRAGATFGATLHRSWLGRGAFDADVDGVAVRAAIEDGRGVVAARAAIPEDLVVVRRGRGPLEGQRTGDTEFDRAVAVSGETETCLALLDVRVRAMLVEGTKKLGISVVGGVAYCSWSRYRVGRAGIERRVRVLAEIARALSRRDRGIETIGRNASLEPIAAVRERILRHLVTRHSGERATIDACRAGLADPFTATRMVAALGLPDGEGATTLEAIFEEASIPAALRAEGLLAAATAMPRTIAVQMVSRGLATVAPSIKAAAVRGAGRLRDATSLVRLADMPMAWDEEVQIALADAIAGLGGDPRFEPCLLSLLRVPQAKVALAAARALGTVGSLAAVEPLLEVRKPFVDADLRRAIDVAVTNIRARIGGSSGALALADDPLAGALSAASDSGALTLAPSSKRDAG